MHALLTAIGEESDVANRAKLVDDLKQFNSVQELVRSEASTIRSTPLSGSVGRFFGHPAS